MLRFHGRSIHLLLGILIALILLALHPAAPAHAASFVVTSTGDQPDETSADGICKIMGSNNCTLRAAMQQANASAGHDVITFTLGSAIITPATALPDLTDDAGATIFGNRNITLNGNDMVVTGIRILNSRKNKIQGLIIRDFTYGIGISGALFNVASDNLIGTNADGTNDVQERNVLRNNSYGVYVRGWGSNHNVIAGNNIGTNSAGSQSAPNVSGIMLTEGAGYTLIGTNGDGINDAAESNVISGNQGGIVIEMAGTATIAGNYIGLRADGQGALGNAAGIIIRNSNLNRIGTDGNGIADAAERNIISSNTNVAIEMTNVTNTVIAGNLIGTRADGTGNRGNGNGIIIAESASTGNMIGGDTPAEGNNIAHSGLWGVVIAGDLTTGAIPVNNSILFNSIFDTGTLGIDLRPIPTMFPVDANDPGDVDAGPNNLLNHPEVVEAVTDGTSTTLTARITNGLVNVPIHIQFFSSPDCDSSGYGEGEVFLGGATTVTDATGSAILPLVLPIGVTVGHQITATATDPTGNTSEFSACFPVTGS